MVSLAVYLSGISFIALSPPWEGYDEIAHYSYAQQLADIAQVPSFESGKLSMDIERYKTVAPMPYMTTPPFDDNGGFTYRQWLAGPSNDDPIHDSPANPRVFAPAQALNWQAQHPPLYYRLIAPLITATADQSWAAQLFWLRLISWSVAFAGLAIGVAATAEAIRVLYPRIIGEYCQVVSFWVLLFPGLLPEFARLGNDALVMLLFGMVWAWAAKRAMSPLSWWWYVGLGVLLGLGGLTKVTFLPITLVMVGWLLWIGTATDDARERARTWFGTLIVTGLFLTIASRGYLTNVADRGSLTGLVELTHSDDFASWGWLAGFKHPQQLLKGLLNIGLTFIWGGTASSAYPPVILVLPLLLMTAVLALASLCRVRVREPLSVLAIWVISVMFASLVYYLLVRIADDKIGSGTPGWYLHILMPPLSLLFALGANELRSRFSNAALAWRIWLGYSFCLFAGVAWLQLSLFAGCTFKTATSRIYHSADWSCLMEFAAIYRHLERLTFPVAGFSAFAIAMLLACFAVLPWGFIRSRSVA